MRFRRRARGERASTLVEAAAVIGVIALIAMGTIEYGYAWRQTTVVEKTVQQSARVVASVADGPYADFEALETFRSLLDSSKNIELELLVVYKSTTANGQVPAGCLTASVANVCNRYVENDVLTLNSGDFANCSWPAKHRFWCPTTRERERDPSPDYVGVYARLRYEGITNAIPGGLEIERHAVYAVEPCAYGLPGC